MINQTAAGIYSWLHPWITRFAKIEAMCSRARSYYCHRILMPTLQPASLWKRNWPVWKTCENVAFKDRHDR